MHTVKKLPLNPYLSKTGFAKSNSVLDESSNAKIIILLLLNPFLRGGNFISPVLNDFLIENIGIKVINIIIVNVKRKIHFPNILFVLVFSINYNIHLQLNIVIQTAKY